MGSRGASSASAFRSVRGQRSASAPDQNQQLPVADILHSATEESQEPFPPADNSSESTSGESDDGLPPSGANGSAPTSHEGGKRCAFCLKPLGTLKRKNFGRYCGMPVCKCADIMTCEHALVCKKHGEFFINGIHWFAADPANRSSGHNGHCAKVNKCPGCRVRDIKRCKAIGMSEEAATYSSPRRKTKVHVVETVSVTEVMPGSVVLFSPSDTATSTTATSASSTAPQQPSGGQDSGHATGFLVSPDPMPCGDGMLESSSALFSFGPQHYRPTTSRFTTLPCDSQPLRSTLLGSFELSRGAEPGAVPLAVSRTTRPYVQEADGDGDPEHKRSNLPDLGDYLEDLSSFLDLPFDLTNLGSAGGADLETNVDGEEEKEVEGVWRELDEDEEF